MTKIAAVTPFRVFSVEVRRVSRLSPAFSRVTFAGDDLDCFADNGFDQRIKLAFPLAGLGCEPFPTGPDWYAQWRALPPELQNPLRTYTARAVRPDDRELDVDFVRHGDHGPATRWVGTAQAGDRLMVVGPDARYPGRHGGVEFRLPAGDPAVLLAGDETAVPALAGILARLPAGARGEALLEVPTAADELPLTAPAGVRVSWLPRSGEPHGSRLVPAVAAAAARLRPGSGDAARLRPGPAGVDPAAALPEVDIDGGILWEVPADPAPAELYAWLAGEAGVIRTLRRGLVRDSGVDRGAVAFMGYWRHGRAEAGG